ncbi:probable disease resistance protein At5g66900 isoform X2 [Carica papaya]|uniref:probable disease resistance protein At5g66900 isoform X2 n=1 Tax=Carica papaya TaxID=3649 RepID=UPI000B8CF504|nr:probable disease resistance protein At5g66900 isoform X2 [Carica papaya]
MEIFGSEKSVIVVSAPAGCGKTTLVKKLCQDEEVKEKFGNQNIFFLTFSELPNIEVIVQRLFQHKNWEVPELVDENDAINQLGLLLQKIGECPILLVLDDVWDRSQSLLDEFVCQLPHNSKILVTSRSDFPKFGPPYNLKPLNHDDAMNLFSHSAILNDGNSYLPDKDTVEKIVKACNGFPLALKVVGGSLRGQPRAVWRSQALKLSKGAFPEDQRIPASALIDIWTELYELDEDGIHAMANLHRLSLQNLLNLISLGNEEIEEDGFYNEHFVTQHDLLRELIILESSLEPVAERRRLIAYINGNKFPEWWLEQKQSTSACLMSISTDEAFSSRWHKIQLPHVEALVLNFQSKNYKLPVFIEKLDELKVLVVTNYGFFPTQICNFPLVGSLSNLKRIRLEKISVPSFSFNSLRLKNLQKICLVMCDTGEGFSEISDSFPNLVEIDIDYCNAMKEFPDGFCDLIQLKKLSITNCHKISTLPGRIGNLMNLETLRLSSCIDLSELPDTIGRLRNLRHLNISDCVSIGKLPTQIGEMCSLRRLFMNNCTNCELPLSIGKLEHLEVLCDEETALQWANLEAYFKNLKITVIQEDTNLNWLPLNSHHF